MNHLLIEKSINFHITNVQNIDKVGFTYCCNPYHYCFKPHFFETCRLDLHLKYEFDYLRICSRIFLAKLLYSFVKSELKYLVSF